MARPPEGGARTVSARAMANAIPSLVTQHRMNSALLSVCLKEQIARHGSISLERYMDACLADADAGYYRARQPIGASGDFITAPEVSQIFGELLGLWAYAVWQSMGSPATVTLAELGPGRGTLMADALRALRRLPDFLACAKIVMLETSPVLRASQEDMLKDAPETISWCEQIELLPQGPLIVIANEFVDALPIQQFIWRRRNWHERRIKIGPNGGFVFCDGPVIARQSLGETAGLQDLPEGAILEIRPAANALMAELAARGEGAPLAGLIIDYGHEATGCADTLQAMSRHAFADPLQTPGAVDLTAHVDFAALKEVAAANGLRVYGPKPQGALLLELGLEARRDRLCKDADENQCQDIISGARRLIDPSAMGLLFKALAITSKDLAPPPPFSDS